MDECLLNLLNDFKKEQIDWLTNKNNDILKDFSK